MVNWIILKIAQRCNLDCTYCYVYNRGDDSWKERPKFISEAVTKQVSLRILEQCSKYSLSEFVVELHGGEPLLLGKARMRRLLDNLIAGCAPIKLEFLLQTNGLLLDVEWLELFDQYGVHFGIGIDGPPEIADKFRIFHNGQGSTLKLLRLIARLRSETALFDQLFGGALCVVDPSQNGSEMVDWFVSQGFNKFDFLLPDATYRNLP